MDEESLTSLTVTSFVQDVDGGGGGNLPLVARLKVDRRRRRNAAGPCVWIHAAPPAASFSVSPRVSYSQFTPPDASASYRLSY